MLFFVIPSSSIDPDLNMESTHDDDQNNMRANPMSIWENYTLLCKQEWLRAKTDVDRWADGSRLTMDECVKQTILAQTIKVCSTLDTLITCIYRFCFMENEFII